MGDLKVESSDRVASDSGLAGIDVGDRAQLLKWSKRFRVSPRAVQAAVEKVGNHIPLVEHWLSTHPRYRRRSAPTLSDRALP